MTKLFAVTTTRSGQTSTYWATSLAWTLAATRTVMLVDCDMEGGTIADLLFLSTDGRSVANCFGERATTVAHLAAQRVAVRTRPNLTVVPGLRGSCGLEIADCLRALGPALQSLDCDTVIADLGHPFAHPGLRSQRAAAEAVCALFHRHFVVVRDEPALMARTIDVLRSARPAHGEIVVCQQRGAQYRQSVIQTLERELPEYPIRDGWRWDAHRAQQLAETGQPIVLGGIAEELYL